MLKSLVILISLFHLLGLDAAQAQQPQISPAENARLSRQFRDGFLKGCNAGKSTNANAQRSYCNCLADAYQARYSGVVLRAISQVAGASGENGARLTSLMMSPEASACSAKSR